MQSTIATETESGLSRRALILTALGLETAAVLAHLPDYDEAEPVRGTVFYEGRVRGPVGNWLVRVAEVGAGNVQRAITAERAITEFAPEVAIFVGIAGGIKDVQLGDVVAATEVYGYERGKDEAEGFRARTSVGRSAYDLARRAAAVVQAGK
jgi:nucleoside phosphorylase